MAKNKKAETKTTASIGKGVLLSVTLANVRTTGTNPRKHFNDEDIEELALSIKSVGLLQPIVCMKAEDDFIFTLICGERRYRAALKAGLVEVPGIVYDPLPDDVVFEMQITENLQRKDINSMEESNAFAELVKRGLKTPEQIADKLGVSTKYIYDRLALQKVIPAVQENILKGTISISHGKQFARLQVKDQVELWDNLFLGDDDDNGNPLVHEDVSIAEMRNSINESFSRKLSNAIFETSDPTLIKKAGACTACPKRSGCNKLLFDDIHQEDICFDKGCYQSKIDAHLEKLFDSLTSEEKTVVKINAGYSSITQSPKDALAMSEWSESAKSNVLGLIVQGSPWKPEWKLGAVIPIKLRAIEQDDEDTDDDEGETPAYGISRLVGESSSPSNKQLGVDWQEVLLRRLDEQVINFFICNPTMKIRSVIIENCVSEFRNLNDDTATLIAEKFKWEIVREKKSWQTEPCEDFRKTALNAIEKNDYSNGILLDLTHFFTVLNSYDESITYGDFQDFQEAEGLFFHLGINLRDEIKKINEEAGCEEIEIPEPEKQEAEEETE